MNPYLSNNYITKLLHNVLLLAALSCGSSGILANDITGPSSSEAPYLLPTQPGVVTVSVLTAGDSVNLKPDGMTPYRMVGIPDGLGAFDNSDGTFTLLANHELTNAEGVTRAHGFRGAFVSKWTIDKDTLTVIHGEDLMQHVYAWNCGSNAYIPLAAPLSHFCSADLPALSAFYNAASGLGYNGRIYMNGEEIAEGRNFGHLMNGHSYELPWLGKFAHENSVANPATGNKTVVAGLDDTNPRGQVYIYVGDKTASADPIEAAGLKNGSLYGIKVTGFPLEDFNTGIPSGTPFTFYNLGDVHCLTGAQLEALSVANDVTGFWRPEDGSWDPVNPHDFYFVTTASFTGASRLWRLRFNDPAKPAAGGTIDMLLNGTEGQKMLDNITITRRGEAVALEDVGNNAHLGKVWRYNIATGSLKMIAQHDPDRFAPGARHFLTIDEESSGVIPMDDILGEGWYLLDVQAHYGTDTELVEGGQFLALHLHTPAATTLGNISTRAFVQSGDDVMIGGFIVQGTEPKRVIIRAIGPELTQYGVPNALGNPTLELHDSTGALIASNDNWRTTIIGGIITANQVGDIQASGYAPSDGRESAIVAELPAGNYTAIVRGVNSLTGVALVEVYDLSSGTNSILANISTRSFVQTGDNVMIGGFMVQGTASKRVIVRAIGPELSRYGVPDVLANPTLELHDGTGALIASNDNWITTIIGGIITANQFRDIQASGHAPGDGRESAIIADLPPGNYTAIVRGVNNTTGVALVEVYDLQ